MGNARLKQFHSSVVSAFPPPLWLFSAELRRDLAEARSAKAGRRTCHWPSGEADDLVWKQPRKPDVVAEEHRVRLRCDLPRQSRLAGRQLAAKHVQGRFAGASHQTGGYAPGARYATT